MRYIFMNKRTPVFKVDMSLTPLRINECVEVYNLEFLPVSVRFNNARGTVNLADFREWFAHRRQPEFRINLNYLLETLNINTIEEILLNNYGLSLTDQYWFKPEDVDLSWDEINYFDNDISGDLGEVIFGIDDKVENWASADAVTDGGLQKTWVKENDNLFLYKYSSPLLFDEIQNEVFASKLAEIMGFDHVPYVESDFHGIKVSSCPNMIDANTELISIRDITIHDTEWGLTHSFNRLVKLLEAAGISDARESLEDILVLDALVANEDRHMRNFGIIRNVETLEFIKVASIYDNGMSMHKNIETSYIPVHIPRAMPFARTHTDQVGMANLRRYDFDKLDNIEEHLYRIYSTNEGHQEEPERKEVMAEALKKRIEVVKDIQLSQPRYY